MKSIKRYLIIALTLSISVIASLGVITSLIIQHDEMQPQLDATLAYQAHIIDSLLDLKNSDHLGNAQKKINSLPQEVEELTFIHPGQEEQINQQLKSIQFLVFHITPQTGSLGTILLHSPHAPNLESVGLEGFSTLSYHHQDWRSYTLLKKDHAIVVFQKMGVRTLLESRTATRSTVVILCSFLLIYLIITYSVNRCLSFLSIFTQRVKRKRANDLSSIPLDASIPSEITPLIEALNKLFHTLNTLIEREKRFAADAAHELKTPIAALKTQIQICMNHPHGSPFIHEQLEKMLLSIDRQAHTVQQLLTMSRSMVFPNEAIESYNAVFSLKETIANLTPLALKKNINIELHSCEEALLEHNPVALSIVFRNLIDNAIRYSPPNSLIIIQSAVQHHHFIIDVIDEGPGIPDEMKLRVFERFFRIVGSQTNGSGLGLSIVKHIIQQLKGSISLNDRDSQSGLHIRIEIPTQDHEPTYD